MITREFNAKRWEIEKREVEANAVVLGTKTNIHEHMV